MSFNFTPGETPEQAAKRRQSTMDMLERGATQAPQNAGQGMSAVAQALAYRRMQGQQPQAGGPAAPGAFPASVMKLFGR